MVNFQDGIYSLNGPLSRTLENNEQEHKHKSWLADSIRCHCLNFEKFVKNKKLKRLMFVHCSSIVLIALVDTVSVTLQNIVFDCD